jgi:hypothetical protein
MAKLKKYTSFEALKSDESLGNAEQSGNHVFSEFEAFLNRLRSEYSNKKKTKTNNGKHSDR